MYQLSLDGNWEMRSEQEKEWLSAHVPGSVFQNLLDAKRIEDPFYRDNEIDAKKVSEKDYFFRKRFCVSKELLEMEQVVLWCEGIDTIAEIYINGNSVLCCNNMHRTWEAEIAEWLRTGENEILVHFTSPYRQIETIRKQRPHRKLEGQLLHARLQMRKAAYMFGWDWGPELADMGIWKSIGIRGYQGGRIRQFRMEQIHGFEKVTLKYEAEVEYFKEQMGGICRVCVFDPDGMLLHQQDTSDGKGEIVISHPKLWWCNGYGEQPLYTVKCELFISGEKEAETDRTETRIGLRTLKLRQEKDQWGTSFYFEINGVEVFARGADCIPEDSFPGRVTPEQSRKLLDSCVKANFNMVRIWGGGVYPSDAFLDYCDEKGIMLWHDFMFANALCLWEGKEKENMLQEVTEQTRRLRDHPCIALLCGNNEAEMEMAGWKEITPEYREMYIQQYEVDMPAIVRAEAPELCYWPSSPSSTGSMIETENENYGDSHDWRVWHGELPFTHYRSTFPRFNSEFGLQSFPCMKTIEAFTLPEDRNIFSYVMENHQKSNNGNRVINSYISQYFKFPKDFRALIYLSQMIQMEGIRYGVEHWRRNRNDRRCMGSLFWQINDCWPVASWASIDSFGRWKGLQYGAKRFYEPVLVSACEEGTTVDLYVSNETLVATEGAVKWKLFHVKKGLVKEGEVGCRVSRLRTERIIHLEFGDILKTRQDMREYYLAYAYESEGKVIGEGAVLFVQAKHFELQNPQIHCEKIGPCTWKVQAEQFAKFVELDFGEDILLSDNYFDLIPGQEKVVTLEREPEKDADREPAVYSLYDSFEK